MCTWVLDLVQYITLKGRAQRLEFEMKVTTDMLFELRNALRSTFDGNNAEAHVYFSDGPRPTNRPVAWARDIYGVERELHIILL